MSSEDISKLPGASSLDDELPSLVVCRDFGARGLTVCKLIQDYLSRLDESGKWQLYAEAAHEMERNHESFLGLPSATEEGDRGWDRETLCHLIQQGHGLFVGDREVECSAHLKNVFRVRLTGSISKRIEWLGKVYGLDPAKARLCILSHEEARRNRGLINGLTIDHPLNYHLTLNTDDLSEILICRLIADSLMEWWEARSLSVPTSYSRDNKEQYVTEESVWRS